MYQPKTGKQCSCKRGVERDNCPRCEGTGWVIDFRAIRESRPLRMRPIASVFVLGALLAASVGAQPICRVNVNASTQAELEALPRVGPALAGRIIAARPLADLAALDSVKGIGPKVLQGIKPFASFEGATDTSGCAELVKASKPTGT